MFHRPGSMNSNFTDEETDSEKIKHFAKTSLKEKKKAKTITVFSPLKYVTWQLVQTTKSEGKWPFPGGASIPGWKDLHLL